MSYKIFRIISITEIRYRSLYEPSKRMECYLSSVSFPSSLCAFSILLMFLKMILLYHRIFIWVMAILFDKLRKYQIYIIFIGVLYSVIVFLLHVCLLSFVLRHILLFLIFIISQDLNCSVQLLELKRLFCRTLVLVFSPLRNTVASF